MDKVPAYLVAHFIKVRNHMDGDDAVDEGWLRSRFTSRSPQRAMELQGTGYLTLRANGVGKVDRRLNPAASFDLSTVCDCYRSEHFHYVVLPAVPQLVGGASGGLVVWLLSLLVG